MKNDQPMRRRKFLKAGIGVSLLAAFPLQKLLPFSSSVFGQDNERDRYRLEQDQDKIHEICLKYGGEFAGVRPELRRNSHGSV